MKFQSLVFIFLLAITACQSRESSKSSTEKDKILDAIQKKIQPEEDILFTCDDLFNRTRVLLNARWNQLESRWRVDIEEVNLKGFVVQTIKNLIGEPDHSEELHMNIRYLEQKTFYARLVQTNINQAQYSDSARVLSCVFE